MIAKNGNHRILFFNPQDVFELIAVTVAPLAQHLNDRQEGFSRRSQRILGMRGATWGISSY